MSSVGRYGRGAGLAVKIPALSLQKAQRQGRGTRFAVTL